MLDRCSTAATPAAVGGGEDGSGAADVDPPHDIDRARLLDHGRRVHDEVGTGEPLGQPGLVHDVADGHTGPGAHVEGDDLRHREAAP